MTADNPDSVKKATSDVAMSITNATHMPPNAEYGTPSPYYDDGRCVIYHGDAREILPTLTADVILTDLPYGIGLDYGEEFTDDAASLDALIAEVLPMARTAAPVVALTCGIGNVWRYPPPTWILCWYLVNAHGTTGRWGFNQWQPLLVYGTDPYLTRSMGRRPDVISTSASTNPVIVAAGNRIAHPCPKPLASWRQVLFRVSPAESDIVVDPLMGAGATLVAAKYSGRRAIGIEINERFCEVAARRLGQELLDLDYALSPNDGSGIASAETDPGAN